MGEHDPHPEQPDAGRALAALHRFARRDMPGRARPSAAAEPCELCAEPLPADHRHLLEIAPTSSSASPAAGGEIRCICRTCTLLFDREANGGRYRLLPDRRLLLRDVAISDAQWQALQVPVGLAFIGYRAAAGKVIAAYPGASGSVEAEVDPGAWEELQQTFPVLGTLEPDLEALLIYRVRTAQQYFVAPIDDCYRLAAVVRAHWRGLTGGTQVWTEVERFFETLERRSRVI